MSDIDTSEDNNPLEGVEDVEIQEEMEQSFLDYYVFFQNCTDYPGF